MVVGIGCGLLVAWAVSTFFFMVEAWGARGMTKSTLFELWAAMTWCGGPLLILAVFSGAAVLALRERPKR